MDDSEDNGSDSGDEDEDKTNENAEAEESERMLRGNNAMISGGSQSNIDHTEGAVYVKEFDEHLTSAEEDERGELSIGLDLKSHEDRPGGGRRNAPTVYETASGGTPEGPIGQSDGPKYRKIRSKLNLVEGAYEERSKFRGSCCEDLAFCPDPDYAEFEDFDEDRDVEEDEDEGDDEEMTEEYDHDDDDDDDARPDWFFEGLSEQEWSEFAQESALESGSKWGRFPSAADGFNVDNSNGDIDYQSPSDELGARRRETRGLSDGHDERQKWPKPSADVSYGSTVEEQVVLLGGSGRLLSRPEGLWAGRRGEGGGGGGGTGRKRRESAPGMTQQRRSDEGEYR